MAPSTGSLVHLMHGLSLKQHSKGVWDWELAASRYDYVRDAVRTPLVPVAGLDSAGRGSLTDLSGSGWQTYALKGIWRPVPAHVVEMGLQGETAMLRNAVRATADWRSGAAAGRLSTFNGNTRLQSLYLQDAWRWSQDFKTTLGLRYEHWQAFGGEMSNASSVAPLPLRARAENSWSPKAALAWKGESEWGLKASLGRAVRNPTASELFQGSIVDQVIVNTNPALRAEKSWTGELSAERTRADDVLRLTLFHETTRDALYSQALTPTVNTVQNVDQVRTHGLELAHQADDVLVPGLTVNSSVTWADSIIAENQGFPASVGKRQPRVPDWRANLMAAWRLDDKWSATFGVRYSGRQFGTLDNSDPHGDTYTGVSTYTVADVRLRYRFDRHWSAAVGVDNLNNATYWAFHPYTQRTVLAELRWDL
ncbi:TonB-dependent receptor [Massilia sp. H-1]|nr:TonB-dependent receptor [Massilia sp. H-1]